MMARGRDHFSVGLREKKNIKREKEREVEKKVQNVVFRDALRLRSHERIALNSMLRQNERSSRRHLISSHFNAPVIVVLKKKKKNRRDEHDSADITSRSNSELTSERFSSSTERTWSYERFVGQERKFSLAAGRRRPRNSANAYDKK